MIDYPEKTRKVFQSTYGGLCAVVEEYNNKELRLSHAELKRMDRTPGSCTWEICHKEFGELGRVIASEQPDGTSALEINPKILVSREEVLNSKDGPGVVYAEAVAIRDRTPEALEVSDQFYDDAKNKLSAEAYYQYTEFEKRLVSAIDASLLGKKQGENMSLTGNTEPAKKRGVNLRTEERFEVFQRIKSQHLSWSQSKVAMEAREVLQEEVTAETVRNTYRLMGKKWERGDRIR